MYKEYGTTKWMLANLSSDMPSNAGKSLYLFKRES